MKVKYRRPRSRAAQTALTLARCALLLFLASLALHRFGPLKTQHFIALASLSSAVAAVSFCLALVGLVRLWQVAAVAGVASMKAIALSAVPLAAAGMALSAYATRPALYDIATDPADPPAFPVPLVPDDGWLSRSRIVTGQDRAAQRAAYPGLTGRRYDGALDRVLVGVESVITKTGMTVAGNEVPDATQTDLEDRQALPEPLGKSANAGTGVEDADVFDVAPVPETRPDSPRPGAGAVLAEIRQTGRSPDALLQGAWRTPIAGFRFDVVIRLREEAETTLVDLRIAARTGGHDLGSGAAFAERFLQALDAELLGISGG